jgi:hypothetical protein
MSREVGNAMSSEEGKGRVEEDTLIPEKVEEYRKKEYWDWRYEQEK